MVCLLRDWTVYSQMARGPSRSAETGPSVAPAPATGLVRVQRTERCRGGAPRRAVGGTGRRRWTRRGPPLSVAPYLVRFCGRCTPHFVVFVKGSVWEEKTHVRIFFFLSAVKPLTVHTVSRFSLNTAWVR